MTKKVFLDTNIIIDFLDDKREKHLKVQELMEHLILNNYTIVISEDMISTIFYIVKNKKATLSFFQNIIKSKRWEIIVYGVLLIEEAVNIAFENDLDLEDLLQCLCAKENGCELLITEDKYFYDCGISIYTADNFLKSR